MSRVYEGWRTRVDTMSQPTRRIIAAASLVGLPGMFGWYAFWHQTAVPSIYWGPVSFVLIALTGVGGLVLYAFAGDRATRGARLDERQRQLRDRAWILSYEVLSAVVIAGVGVLGVMVLGFGRTVTLDGATAGPIVLCIGVLIPLLPAAALAWVEPNPPAEG